MIISTTTLSVMKMEDNNYKDAISMIKQAGFDAYDISLCAMEKNENCIFNGEDYIKTARELRDFADKIGIPCNQAHAPYPSSYIDDEKTAAVYGKIVRSMEIAAILGAKYIVIHPMHHLTYRTNIELLREKNKEFYLSLVPYCKKYGIKVAVENMWQREPYYKGKTRIVDSVCSHPEEFCEYLDMLPKEHFAACLDIGHAVLTNENITRMVNMLGRERLKAIHIHDNKVTEDDHLLPYLGDIPMDEMVSALRGIGYEGDFTLETVRYENRFPEELRPEVVKLSYKVAKYLADKIAE